MITSDETNRERKLWRLEVARVILGVAVIIAAGAVVLCGIDAFTTERDAWLAMRLPLFVGTLLVWSFARSARAIVTLKAIRRR